LEETVILTDLRDSAVAVVAAVVAAAAGAAGTAGMAVASAIGSKPSSLTSVVVSQRNAAVVAGGTKLFV